ncbi:hypothetical protein [Agrobacterium tumefaciens]|uniref:hypothetical protein n=1 Tax=Agrobacterium tumefaciens TaxID=358 RepID=UPI001F15CA9E
MAEIRSILNDAGLDQTSDRLAKPDADLLAENRRRIASARSLMTEFRVNGVPALIINDGQRRRLVKANELFGKANIVAAFSGLSAN